MPTKKVTINFEIEVRPNWRDTSPVVCKECKLPFRTMYKRKTAHTTIRECVCGGKFVAIDESTYKTLQRKQERARRETNS